MGAEEELFQMNVLHGERAGLYKILLDSLQANHYAVFESLLKRGLKKYPPSIHLDYIYPYPINKTLLDIACSEGRPDFVRLLLDLGASPNKKNESHHRAPIHFATESGHHDVIVALLEDPRTNPNLEVNRETALHFAVKKNDINCAKVLLENNSSPNVPNNKGVTPLHSAATSGNREMVDVILYHSRLSPDIDSFRDFRKRSARDILTDKFPDLTLPPVQERPIDFNVLRFYLDANDEENFLKNLKNLDDKNDSTKLDGEDKLIVIAAERNLKEAVSELLSRRELGNIPRAALEVSARRGHYDILDKLLKTGTKVDNEVLMIACQELGVPCRYGIEQQSRIKCLKLLLDRPDVEVRFEDEKGNCPLHYAARAEDAEAVDLLLKAGSYIGHMNAFGVPPMAHISPKILEDHLDSCLRSKSDRTDDYEIEFDYKCLMPHAAAFSQEETTQTLLPKSSRASKQPTHSHSEMDTLSYISKNPALKHLLKHPIISSFLQLKWHRMRHIFYANCVFYVFFYIFINLYILVLTYTPVTTDGMNSRPLNTSDRLILISEENNASFWSLTAIFLLCLAIRELLQFLSSPKHYIRSFENVLEVILIILAAAVLFGAGNQIGALVILLSAWELVLLIGQHPKMSTGIEMFKTVTWNFLRFLLLYAFLILAFALAFFTLFKDVKDENFLDPGTSIFKTIIMLTGEFDASSIPFLSRPGLSHFIFVLFVFLIAIVLFNLLNGLAVSDTADILGRAELVGLISRTELVAYAERIAVGTGLDTRSRSCMSHRYRRTNLFGFIAKRLLLFRKHLLYGKLGVKPYKGNIIILQGLESEAKNCRRLTMDNIIVERAREILKKRNEISENEKIITELEIIKSYLQRVEVQLKDMQRGNGNNHIVEETSE